MQLGELAGGRAGPAAGQHCRRRAGQLGSCSLAVRRLSNNGIACCISLPSPPRPTHPPTHCLPSSLPAGRSHGKATTFARLADPMGFVAADDVFHAVKAVVAVQRDYGRRDDRKQVGDCLLLLLGVGCKLGAGVERPAALAWWLQVLLGQACAGWRHSNCCTFLPPCLAAAPRQSFPALTPLCTVLLPCTAGAPQVPDCRVGHGQVPQRGGAVHGQEAAGTQAVQQYSTACATTWAVQLSPANCAAFLHPASLPSHHTVLHPEPPLMAPIPACLCLPASACLPACLCLPASA